MNLLLCHGSSSWQAVTEWSIGNCPSTMTRRPAKSIWWGRRHALKAIAAFARWSRHLALTTLRPRASSRRKKGETCSLRSTKRSEQPPGSGCADRASTNPTYTSAPGGPSALAFWVTHRTITQHAGTALRPRWLRQPRVLHSMATNYRARSPMKETPRACSSDDIIRGRRF